MLCIARRSVFACLLQAFAFAEFFNFDMAVWHVLAMPIFFVNVLFEKDVPPSPVAWCFFCSALFVALLPDIFNLALGGGVGVLFSYNWRAFFFLCKKSFMRQKAGNHIGKVLGIGYCSTKQLKKRQNFPKCDACAVVY